MNVRLDERGGDQIARGVQVARQQRDVGALLRLDGADALVLQFDAEQAAAATQAGVDNVYE